jgi:hypothetical protein
MLLFAGVYTVIGLPFMSYLLMQREANTSAVLTSVMQDFSN